jgi:phosphoribosylformylglycinamidine synthase
LSRAEAGSSEPGPTIAVVVFPGSNDDRDTQLALERLGALVVRVWHAEELLPDGTAAVVLPGGFSYGDYLRCGAIARFSPVMDAVGRFADEGGVVLGICNGFQILTEAGLLPGALRPNESLSFTCRDVRITVERTDTPLTTRCDIDQPGTDRSGRGQPGTSQSGTSRAAGRRTLTLPVKNGEGCWFADPELLAELESNRQLLFRYAPGENPNGAVADVAGVCNEHANVVGLMPHPEHAVDPLLGSTDGALLLGSLVDAARLSAIAFV